MPSNYDGIPDNVTGSTALNILSTTDTSPIAVTVSGSLPTDFLTGAKVHIDGHPINFNANGIWKVTVTGASSFTIPAAGNGLGPGPNVGTVQPLNLTPYYQVPSDGDLANESSIDTMGKNRADREQFLALQSGAFKLAILASMINMDDPTAVAVWSTTVTGAANTPTSMIALPGLPLVGIVAGDFIELDFHASSAAGQSWPSGAQIYLSYVIVSPGVAPPGTIAGWTRVQDSGVTVQQSATGGQGFLAKGLIQSSATGILAVAPTLVSIAGSGTYKLSGDASLLVHVWRPTGMPQ